MSPNRSKGKPSRRSEPSEIAPDRAKQRRAQYASDPAAAEAQRNATRTRYQNSHPRPPKLANGLLSVGTIREITHDDLEHPVTVESFTIPEAAIALGRSEATLRRWISADKIPAPYLLELGKGDKVYSIGEMRVMSSVLVRHDQDYTYLTSTDTQSSAEMHEHMHAYRSHHI